MPSEGEWGVFSGEISIACRRREGIMLGRFEAPGGMGPVLGRKSFWYSKLHISCP